MHRKFIQVMSVFFVSFAVIPGHGLLKNFAIMATRCRNDFSV